MIIVLMGVAGSGKTTIGHLVAAKLGWPFLDGDDFHPAANVEKMSHGIPLTDEDRLPWLQRLAFEIHKMEMSGQSAVLACSALKDSYREILLNGNAHVAFVYLKGDYDLIYARLAARKGHFMKPELLKSQFAALEETKDLIAVDVNQRPDEVASEIILKLNL